MENYEETIRTLNKIQSVREITNYPKQNADKIYETLTKNKEYVAKLDPFGGVDSESITILRNPKDTLKLLNERLTELENLPQSFYIRGPLEPIIRFACIPTDELKEKVKSCMNSFIKFEPMKQIELVDMIVNDQLESEDYEILNVQLKWLDFQFQTFFSQNKVNLSSKNKFHADLYITEYNKLCDDLSDMLKLKTICTNIPEENTLNVDSAKLQRLKVILLSLKDKNSFIFKIIDSYNNLKLNKMNKTTASMVSQGGTNIKGKLTKLEELIEELKNDMNYHKGLVTDLKSQKENLESVLTMKTQDVRKNLTNALYKVEEEMKRHFAHQKAENSRLQQHIASIKNEKTVVEQQLLGIQRRISELELQIGSEETEE